MFNYKLRGTILFVILLKKTVPWDGCLSCHQNTPSELKSK